MEAKMDKPHMTPDQIKEGAINAGAMAAAITEVNDYGTVAFSGEYHARTWDDVPPSTQAAILEKHRALFRAAIDAYEAAMWRPIEEAPKDGTAVWGWCEGGDAFASVTFFDGAWRYTYDHAPVKDAMELNAFRPLPQEPEVKHEPA